MASTSAPDPDRTFFVVNAVVSAAALGLLAWLLLFHPGAGEGAPALAFLPPLDAAFNALAATLLVAGRVAIARKRPRLHRALMTGAFVASTLFLAGYLTYHAAHGDTRFGGAGAARVAYLGLLASHVLLSIPVVPLALAAFWFAWRRDFRAHTRVTRLLHPVWLYVSVSGVLVYLLLRPYYPA